MVPEEESTRQFRMSFYLSTCNEQRVRDHNEIEENHLGLKIQIRARTDPLDLRQSVIVSLNISKERTARAVDVKENLINTEVNVRMTNRNGDTFERLVLTARSDFRQRDLSVLEYFDEMILGKTGKKSMIKLEYIFVFKGCFPMLEEARELTSFPISEHTDMKITVGDEDFHVSKAVLATHSTYFSTLFYGPFKEANESSVTLQDIDTDIFRDLLAIIYLRPHITDENVMGLLEMARMWDVKPISEYCERFLQKDSYRTLENLLEIAVVYGLDNLKDSSRKAILKEDYLMTNIARVG